MRIEKLLSEPLKSLMYCERYINDGSPSGFTEINRTSTKTDPFGTKSSFNLKSIFENQKSFKTKGEVPNNFPLKGDEFLIHPDMENHDDINKYEKTNSILVTPTSSARTVQILNFDAPYFIKLHYDGIIGRINRKMPYRKAINGYEISKDILNIISENKLPPSFSILHERFIKTHINDATTRFTNDWSFVVRDYHPTGKTADKISYMLPLFSFWSKDRLNKKHSPFFLQYNSLWGKKSTEVILEQLIFQLIDMYFSLILFYGYQIELNAQNILLGFDNNNQPISIIFRDIMGVEKDMTIRKMLNLHVDYESKDYKTIEKEEDFNKWQIRHSFSFDFKFSYYIIAPILNGLTFIDNHSEVELKSKIKKRVKSWISQLPDDYFPSNGIWYLHEDELLVLEKRYITKKPPFLR